MAKLLAIVVSILLITNANSQADGDVNANGVCSGMRVTDSGTYRMWWYGDLDAGTIQINASVDNMGWIAVGISNNMVMMDTDVIIGAINSDNLDENFLEDRYAFTQSTPRLDDNRDIDGTVTLIDNDNATDTDDRVMISFTRRLDTGDDTDDISLLGCHYLLWAWAGPVNDYTTTPATIGRHGQRGVFDDQICCGSAGAAMMSVSIATLLIALVVAVLY